MDDNEEMFYGTLTPLDGLELMPYTVTLLALRDVFFIEQLKDMTSTELKKIPGIGRKRLADIESALRFIECSQTQTP